MEKTNIETTFNQYDCALWLVWKQLKFSEAYSKDESAQDLFRRLSYEVYNEKHNINKVDDTLLGNQLTHDCVMDVYFALCEYSIDSFDKLFSDDTKVTFEKITSKVVYGHNSEQTKVVNEPFIKYVEYVITSYFRKNNIVMPYDYTEQSIDATVTEDKDGKVLTIFDVKAFETSITDVYYTSHKINSAWKNYASALKEKDIETANEALKTIKELRETITNAYYFDGEVLNCFEAIASEYNLTINESIAVYGYLKYGHKKSFTYIIGQEIIRKNHLKSKSIPYKQIYNTINNGFKKLLPLLMKWEQIHIVSK